VLVSFALIHQKGTLFKSLIELNTFLWVIPYYKFNSL
jgi:hypothetical protein